MIAESIAKDVARANRMATIADVAAIAERDANERTILHLARKVADLESMLRAEHNKGVMLQRELADARADVPLEPVDNSKPAERTEWEFNCSRCNTLKGQLATARRLLSYTHPYQSTSSEYQEYRADVERFLEATK